jgi:hypothetical protein
VPRSSGARASATENGPDPRSARAASGAPPDSSSDPPRATSTRYVGCRLASTSPRSRRCPPEGPQSERLHRDPDARRRGAPLPLRRGALERSPADLHTPGVGGAALQSSLPPGRHARVPARNRRISPTGARRSTRSVPRRACRSSHARGAPVPSRSFREARTRNAQQPRRTPYTPDEAAARGERGPASRMPDLPRSCRKSRWRSRSTDSRGRVMLAGCRSGGEPLRARSTFGQRVRLRAAVSTRRSAPSSSLERLREPRPRTCTRTRAGGPPHSHPAATRARVRGRARGTHADLEHPSRCCFTSAATRRALPSGADHDFDAQLVGPRPDATDARRRRSPA